MPELAPEINRTFVPWAEVLHPGDVLDVRFSRMPEWNHDTTIAADGTAGFLGLDEMQAGGLTMEELERRLTAGYEKLLNQADVSVLMKEPAPRHIYVMGEVLRPGEIPLVNGRVTLVDALARAGGPSLSDALLENMLLIRWDAAENRQRWWEMDASQDFWGSGEPVLLQPFDVVYVPDKRIVRANIWVSQHISQMIPFPPSYVVVGAQ